MQGLQLMGMPHPSIFYYVGYVYKKEGLCGCYRGLVPKICERMIVTIVNERIKKSIEKGLLLLISMLMSLNLRHHVKFFTQFQIPVDQLRMWKSNPIKTSSFKT